MEKARNFLRKFRFIRYNPEREWFEFRFSYGDFTEKAAGARQDWTVCTTPEPRYWWDPKADNGKGARVAVDVNDRLSKLLSSAEINYWAGNDLREAICAVEGADFFRELLTLLRHTLSLRQTGEQGEDHIVSPVMDADGGFFHSGRAMEGEPDNADANGAYHIALKGLAFLQKIRDTKDGKRPDLRLDNKQWLAFVQDLRK
jgi:CRISPR-associated protein Cpf1